ncbi:MAG: hypothetical protein WAW52_12060 [Methanothrix sp.]
MQVLHSLWDTETFYIWAESSVLPLSSAGRSGNRKKQHPPQPHPFALPGIELKDLLMQTFSRSGDGCRVEALSLRLPAGNFGPLPSPWLLREDDLSEKPSMLGTYSVPALGLDSGFAFDLLLELPTHPPLGTAYADSMLFWSQLALFSLELVSREQFVPAVKKSRAYWKAVIDEPDQERLNIFSRSMPPSCRSLPTLPSLPLDKAEMATPSRLVHSFVNSAVNATVHSSLDGVSLLPARRGRRPKNVPLQIQFLTALTGEAGLSASASELAPFSSMMDSWTA